MHKRVASTKKGIINNYAHCEKDSETLIEENIKLKEEILKLKEEIIQQKSLINSLQRVVSTPQFMESISTQKVISKLHRALI